jgi:carbohydrate-selective porin OprB
LNFAAKLGQWAVGELQLHQAARDYETVLELTYQSSVAHWWVLQPDLQLIFRAYALRHLPQRQSKADS